jgi:hypothetical protein
MMKKRKDSASKAIRNIRRATRPLYSAEEKIRIALVCDVSPYGKTSNKSNKYKLLKIGQLLSYQQGNNTSSFVLKADMIARR